MNSREKINRHRQELQRLITSNQAITTELDKEDKTIQIQVLENADSNDHNAVLSAVNSGNLDMFAHLVDKLTSLNTDEKNGGNLIKQLLFETSDRDDNNILHLALRSQNNKLIELIADFCEENVDIEERGRLISRSNNNDESPIFLAINNSNETILDRWLNDVEEHPKYKKVLERNVLADRNNCLTTAINNGLATIATRLFILRARLEPYSMSKWKEFINPLMIVVRGHNAGINIVYFVVTLVNYNCTDLVKCLFSNEHFKREFYRDYDHEIFACKNFSVEMRELLFPHCKRGENPGTAYYLITKQTLYALLIYDPERNGGQEQFSKIEGAFKDRNFETYPLVLNEHSGTTNFKKELKKQLREFKTKDVSLLVTCVMSHGGEGYIKPPQPTVDKNSDKKRNQRGIETTKEKNVFLFHILDSINEVMKENTVKVSIFTCCRSNDKLTQHQQEQAYRMGIGLHGVNKVVMTSCAVGEKSVRQNAYTDHLANLLLSGERDFYVMHRKITALIRTLLWLVLSKAVKILYTPINY